MSDLVEEYRRLGAQSFAERWSWPVLVRKVDAIEVAPTEPRTFHTRGNAPVALSEEAMRRSRQQEASADTSWYSELRVDDVLLLRKRPDSTTFADRIGIGRTQNMDVFIDLPRVSKYHAYVTSHEGSIYLCDARSTFGTLIEDRRLEPLVPAELADGMRIHLGPYAFRVHTAAGIGAYVAALVRARDASS